MTVSGVAPKQHRPSFLSRVNEQLTIFMTLYVVLGVFWFPIVLGPLSLITRGGGH